MSGKTNKKFMNYPTLQQVENADRVQLGKWYRYLRSPGWDKLNSPPRRVL